MSTEEKLQDIDSPIGFFLEIPSGDDNKNVRTIKIHCEVLLDLLLGTNNNSKYTNEEIDVAICPSISNDRLVKAEKYNPSGIVSYLSDIIFSNDSGYSNHFHNILPALTALNTVYLISVFFVARYLRKNKSKKDAAEFIFKFLEYDHTLSSFYSNPYFNRKLFLLEYIEEIHEDEVAIAAWYFISPYITEKLYDNTSKEDVLNNTINDIMVPGEKFISNSTFGTLNKCKEIFFFETQDVDDKSIKCETFSKLFDSIRYPTEMRLSCIRNNNDDRIFQDLSDLSTYDKKYKKDFRIINKGAVINSNLRSAYDNIVNLDAFRQRVYADIAYSSYITPLLRTPIYYDAMSYSYTIYGHETSTGKIINTRGVPSAHLLKTIGDKQIEQDRIRKETYKKLYSPSIFGYYVTPWNFGQQVNISTISSQKYFTDYYDNDVFNTDATKPFELLRNKNGLPYLTNIISDSIMISNILIADYYTSAGKDITKLIDEKDDIDSASINNKRTYGNIGNINFTKLYSDVLSMTTGYYINNNKTVDHPIDNYTPIDENYDTNYVFPMNNGIIRQTTSSAPIMEQINNINNEIKNIINHIDNNSSFYTTSRILKHLMDDGFIDTIKDDFLKDCANKLKPLFLELEVQISTLNTFMEKLQTYRNKINDANFYDVFGSTIYKIKNKVNNIFSINDSFNTKRSFKTVLNKLSAVMVSQMFYDEKNAKLEIELNHDKAIIADFDVVEDGKEATSPFGVKEGGTTTSILDSEGNITFKMGPVKDRKISSLAKIYYENIDNGLAFLKETEGSFKNEEGFYGDSAFGTKEALSEGSLSKKLIDKLQECGIDSLTSFINKFNGLSISNNTIFRPHTIYDECIDYLTLGVDAIRVDSDHMIIRVTNDIKNNIIKPIVIAFTKDVSDKFVNTNPSSNIWTEWANTKADINNANDNTTKFDKEYADVFNKKQNEKYIQYYDSLKIIVRLILDNLLNYYNPQTGKIEIDKGQTNVPSVITITGNENILADIQTHTFIKNLILGMRNVYIDLVHRDIFNIITSSFLTTHVSDYNNNIFANFMGNYINNRYMQEDIPTRLLCFDYSHVRKDRNNGESVSQYIKTQVLYKNSKDYDLDIRYGNTRLGRILSGCSLFDFATKERDWL